MGRPKLYATEDERRLAAISQLADAYRRKREAGLCKRCGRISLEAVYCPPCARWRSERRKAKVAGRPRKYASPEAAYEARKTAALERIYRLKTEGKCPACGQPNTGTRWYCDSCTEVRRRKVQASRDRAARRERKAA